MTFRWRTGQARTRGHLAVAMVTRWPMTAIYGCCVARPGRVSDPALRLDLRGGVCGEQVFDRVSSKRSKKKQKKNEGDGISVFPGAEATLASVLSMAGFLFLKEDTREPSLNLLLFLTRI